ncbi:restriction endonuclease subunit S [Elizabethkingia anophelis]|uniref:restriction endonuclease subunit S n=1 Tax=Elizabethkingia anophelis TaxID=1117645 RepID=UPI0021A76EB1|nr:restriction endonuclease subunit S [Elizabethkingia anophelis]MCT4056543.1 restriction endonuclease subunit S [Elizabethkingia anophelis]MCT4089029.1 restriction endonuclease subunit S [Elizabethkingia anophelis]MCT4103291.1 restriction endonuclease subunit S [Elizabethkingia anophelis]
MINVILNDIIEIISGGTPKTSDPKYWENGMIGWLSINDFNNDFRKVYVSEKKITEKGLKESNTKLLNVNDIIISARGTVGALAQIGVPMAFNQSCFGIRGKKNIIDNTYLYYALKNYVANIRKRGQGSVFSTINLNSFKIMEICIEKDYQFQQKIASVLSALDDKIELNNNINAELEQMAKTLYDYWFVQFDFTNEDGKPYKSSGGKMVYNEVLKREIPKKWEISVFNNWIENTKTGDWGKDKIEGNYTERVYCIRGADINGLNGKGEVKAPERFILKNNLSKKLQPNDFIIEISGGSPTQSTARIALLTKESFERFDTNVVCSNFCKAITLKDETYVYNFQQEWQRLYDAGIFFGYEGKTSGIKNFLFESFMDSYFVVEPPKELVLKFNSFAKEIERKRQLNLKQNQELSNLRDWLLPMLMNGQVKVVD